MSSPSANTPLIQIDFHDPDGRPRKYRFAAPETVVVAETVGDVIPALQAVQSGVDAGFYAAGYLAYEAAPAFDPALTVTTEPVGPLAWFGLFREPQSVPISDSVGAFSVSDWQPATSFPAYGEAVATIRAAIAAGDTYQVNYTLRMRAQFQGDDYAFYRHLCAAQQARYCAYLNLGRRRILSASPELFFYRFGDHILTRPMKGTRPRGRWAADDHERAATLARSVKDQAENVMIVDLLRSDLGRIAVTGSVHTPSLFDIERYPTVWQMTSTVTATVQPGLPLADLLSALFPCGSVTGAPKVSTMRLITGLEPSPRQAYCGAIGLLTPEGETLFSVAIRTVLLDTQTGEAEYGTGGGITFDSDAADEYAEAMNKAAILTETCPPFDLLETLRLEGGEYTLLSRHLERLLASARYFGISVSEETVRTELGTLALKFPEGVRRVRLLVSEGGDTVRTEHTPLDALPDPPVCVALARTALSRHNRFLYHKTTHRAFYESHRREHPNTFDVLLYNEDGELTEFTTGNLVVERDGRLLTPPLECGLLPGTLRAEMLAQGRIEENVLWATELAATSRLWLINSVRGWVPVTITPGNLAASEETPPPV